MVGRETLEFAEADHTAFSQLDSFPEHIYYHIAKHGSRTSIEKSMAAGLSFSQQSCQTEFSPMIVALRIGKISILSRLVEVPVEFLLELFMGQEKNARTQGLGHHYKANLGAQYLRRLRLIISCKETIDFR